MFVLNQTVARMMKHGLRFQNIMQIQFQASIFQRTVFVVLHKLFSFMWHANDSMRQAETNRRSGFSIKDSTAVMRLRLCCLLLSASVCGLIIPAVFTTAMAASGRVTIESDGVTRAAILVEHARLKKSRRPVIIILHGGGGNAVRVRHMLGLEEKARSASPVMVYPEAIASHWNDVGKPGDAKDSIFIHDLIVKLISEGIADRHRVFLVGGSSGGLLALKVACSGNVDIAGVVAIFATLPADLEASCKLTHPMPFLMVLGTMDALIPYNGGLANFVDSKTQLLSGKATLDFFGKAAGCSDAHTTTAFADHDTRDNSRAYLDKLSGCKAPVEMLRVEGGGHLLPHRGLLGAGDRAGDNDRTASPGLRNRDVDAPLLIWDFLRHLGA